MAFAGLGQFLAQWHRCPHFGAESAQQADSQLCSVPTVPSTLGHRSTATNRCLHRSARQVREWLSQG